jgi:surface antigen
MIPLFLLRRKSSMRNELLIVFGVMAVLMALPVVAVLSMTNVKALVGTDSTQSATLYTDPAYPGDLYEYGQCTYWASLRRIQIGQPIPNNWGNAATWAVRALLAGYKVDHKPSYGAIMQTPDAAGGLGHVAFVESVNPKDGSWTFSEMNHLGWDEVDTRTFSASAASNYSFIHLN